METTEIPSPRQEGARLMLQGEYLVFCGFAEEPDHSIDGDPDTNPDTDYDLIVAELMALTHRGKHFVEAGIDGYMRLRDLPRLRALHKERLLIDVTRLATIDRALRVLPPGTDPETFAMFDDALVDMFTSPRPGQALPTPWSITRRLRRLIAEVDASVNFNPEKRRTRESTKAPSASFHPVTENNDERMGLTLAADTATMASVGAFLDATAKEHKLSLADSMIKLLTGEITPAPRAVLHIFSPGIDGVRAPGTSAFLPGFGWTGADATAVLDELLEHSPPKVINLDDVRWARVDGYAPTPAMDAYARARDGTCVFPGCHIPAQRCQLDHRIPYGEGGETTPDNLFCMCAHHHNVKTDRRAFYVVDHATGETIWLFSDGSWLTSDNNGILRAQTVPVNPRWKSTPESNHAARARVARFNAQCHAVCDSYDADGNYDACIEDIRALEKEHGLTFEFKPAPEDLSWIPPEPVDGEPPYPDPE